MTIDTVDDSGVIGSLSEGVRTVLNSVTLTLAMVGVLLILIGFIMQTGVLAGLLPIWGAGLAFVGFTAYGLIWRSRK
ncbi:hypothetical protein [Halostagnicola sp. A-GB9-2]|uniref:hypothetical protein n=1 Tax=Halostagnicola sp. A-GB9-2 TaxID=3048066 RepID=UPI0024C080EC|nr:hypothetical protein [Halostagnicola sp. A-GB9-2]MDJ1433633.1 hypothetical protein [Halostagnicola sp. A-GB9-2]